MKNTKQLASLASNLDGVDSMIYELNNIMRGIVEQDSNEFGSVLFAMHSHKPAIVTHAQPLIRAQDMQRNINETEVLGFQSLFDSPVDNNVVLTAFHLPVMDLVPVMTKMRTLLKREQRELKQEISKITK
jgi:hypothetical protein